MLSSPKPKIHGVIEHLVTRIPHCVWCPPTVYPIQVILTRIIRDIGRYRCSRSPRNVFLAVTCTPDLHTREGKLSSPRFAACTAPALTIHDIRPWLLVRSW